MWQMIARRICVGLILMWVVSLLIFALTQVPGRRGIDLDNKQQKNP